MFHMEAEGLGIQLMSDWYHLKSVVHAHINYCHMILNPGPRYTLNFPP